MLHITPDQHRILTVLAKLGAWKKAYWYYLRIHASSVGLDPEKYYRNWINRLDVRTLKLYTTSVLRYYDRIVR